MSLNEIIPAKYRKPVYVAYALVGVALGAIATAFGPEHVPEWHAVTTNVVLYIGGAFGLTAAANTLVTKRVPEEIENAEEIDPEDAGDVPLDEDDGDEEPELAGEVDTTFVPYSEQPRH